MKAELLSIVQGNSKGKMRVPSCREHCCHLFLVLRGNYFPSGRVSLLGTGHLKVGVEWARGGMFWGSGDSASEPGHTWRGRREVACM